VAGGCSSLITLGTPIHSYTLPERLRIWILLPIVRLFGPVNAIVTGIRDVLLSPTTRAQDPEAARLVAECLRSMNRAALVNAVVSISLRRPDLTPQLSQIRCPTLFVTGSDHTGWTPEQAQTAGRRLADGIAEVIPNVAYLIPLEAPDRTVQLVRDLWAQSPQRQVSDNDQRQRPKRHKGRGLLICPNKEAPSGIRSSTGLPRLGCSYRQVIIGRAVAW
jgi:pimeloyl-ACP methyl ester carboxylesterase